MSEITLEDRAHALENEYFHRREQELIAKLRSKLALETAEASHRDCPKCDGKLVESNYDNVKMDVCNKCHGVWLDAGELVHVMNKEEGGWIHRLFG